MIIFTIFLNGKNIHFFDELADERKNMELYDPASL